LPLRTGLVAALLWIACMTVVLVAGWHPSAAVLCAGVYFLVGTGAAIDLIEQLRQRRLEIDGLMVIAAISAAAIGNPLEGSLLLLLFYIAEGLEGWVTQKMTASLQRLQQAHPLKARLLRADRTLQERAVEDIAVGATILVRSGETVPLDGEVMDGLSSVHLAHLTGEATPQVVGPGQLVPSGAVNCEGALVLRVTKPHSESTLSRLLELVKQAQEHKLPLQQWLERMERGYAWSIIGATVMIALLGGSIYKALAFLVVASPCALMIAVPVVLLSSLSACARRGIMVKGNAILSQVARCRNVAFDKTGTLTEGELTCEAIEPLTPGITADEALSLAAGLEMRAVHPIARAIEALATARTIQPATVDHFTATPGVGLEGTVQWKGRPERAWIGAQKEGTVLTVADQRVLFLLRDPVRSTSSSVVQELQQLGMNCCILSGDQSQRVGDLGKQVGIETTHGDLLPQQKMDRVAQLEGCLMVGDGINDAPALARATVGIAMGKPGQTAALEAADIVLLRDDLSQLPWLIRKARSGQKLLIQNVVLAVAAMTLGSVAALVGDLPLWAGVLLHEGGTLLVSLNGLRQLKS
jgi:Cd2+/Zn2+-exporting ATPase